MNHASQTRIPQNLDKVRAQITAAEEKFSRPPGSVQLLAVSKTRPAEDVLAAINENQLHFGENYLQDALTKIGEIDNPEANWHFIGPIQSNKTRTVAENFSWVHTLDRLKIAQRLNEQRPEEMPPLNVCIQVNTSGESSKSGITKEEVPGFARQIKDLPRLKLRGLMTIPAATEDFDEQRKPFRVLRELKEELHKQGIELDTLSMGMTNDIEAAIAEGATMVRIGTAIFGKRI